MKFLPLLLLLWLTPSAGAEDPNYCNWLANANVAAAAGVYQGESREQHLAAIDKFEKEGTLRPDWAQEARNIVNHYWDNANEFVAMVQRTGLTPSMFHEAILEECRARHRKEPAKGKEIQT